MISKIYANFDNFNKKSAQQWTDILIIKMSFANLKQILSQRVKQKGLAQQVTAALVCEEFDKIIEEKWGKKVKNKARALYLKNNTLTIASLSSVMAQEIKLHEKDILNKINKKFNGAVKRIRYLV